MKVGIVTIHHTGNYGAILQAYALSQFIKRQGHEVEIIDYRPAHVEKYYWQGMQFLKFKSLVEKPKFNREALAKYLKYLRFQSFIRLNLPLSKKRFNHSIELGRLDKKYNLVVCGSDQIWCLDSSFRGFDSSFFLDFVDQNIADSIASYAASFGSTDDLGDKQETVYGLIDRFHNISVRDSNSLRLIEQVCGKRATLVLDPTFLIDYKKVTTSPRLKMKYLLLYNHGNLSESENQLIQNLAQSKGLTIVSVGRFNQIADYNFSTAGPSEWLGLIRDSAYVITNTFHGTIFSLIFRREFNVLPYIGKQYKIPDLLKRLELENRILENVEQGQVLLNSEGFSSIDYDKVWKNIDLEVSKSKEYLLSILMKT